jgi:hypothetical protein
LPAPATLDDVFTTSGVCFFVAVTDIAGAAFSSFTFDFALAASVPLASPAATAAGVFVCLGDRCCGTTIV